MPDDPEACWREFIQAAEASASGDHTHARALVARHPVARTELWKFAEAIRTGRMVKTRKGWRMAKGKAKQDGDAA